MVSTDAEKSAVTSPVAGRSLDALPARRQEIVAIAMKLFAQNGVQVTSVRGIGAAAGILSGSLYSHFGSKTEILELGLRPYTEKYLEVVNAIVDTDLTPSAKIYQLLHQSFALMTEWRDATIITNTDWEYILTLEGFEFLRDFYFAVQQAYLVTLREAVEAGQLAHDVDPEMVQRLLREIMLGVARSYRPDSRFPLAMTADYVHRMLFGGLSTPGASTLKARPKESDSPSGD